MSNNPINRKTKRISISRNPTIDDAREVVLKVKKLEGVAKNTIANYEKLFNDFDRFFGEKAEVATLTNADAKDFIYWQLHQKSSF